MFWKKKFSKIIWFGKVIFIIILNFLLHVVFKTLRISVHEFFKNQVDLHQLSSWSTLEVLLGIMTININKVSLKASYDFSFHDNKVINLILELFKSHILGSFFSGVSTLHLSQFILLNCINFILFCFLDSIVLGLNNSCMLILAL